MEEGSGPAPKADRRIISRITLANRTAELGRLARWLEALAPRLPVPEEARRRLDLVLAEAAANVIDHAWDDGAGHAFTVTAACRGVEMELSLVDDGHPFDPRRHPEPRPAARLEDAPPRGRGIHLMRTLSDGWDYGRAGGLNRLTLVVRARRRGGQGDPGGALHGEGAGGGTEINGAFGNRILGRPPHGGGGG